MHENVLFNCHVKWLHRGQIDAVDGEHLASCVCVLQLLGKELDFQVASIVSIIAAAFV